MRTLWGDHAQTDRSPLFTSRLFASEHLITTLKKTELVISHHQSQAQNTPLFHSTLTNSFTKGFWPAS